MTFLANTKTAHPHVVIVNRQAQSVKSKKPTASPPTMKRPRPNKSVRFSDDIYICDYEAACAQVDSINELFTSDEELAKHKHEAARCLQHELKYNNSTQQRLVQLFRTRKPSPTPSDLVALSISPCRGLERKLDGVFTKHRRWAVHQVLRVQSELLKQQPHSQAECRQDEPTQPSKVKSSLPKSLSLTSRRASLPGVNLALFMAAADRLAAEDIYAENNSNYGDNDRMLMMPPLDLMECWSDRSSSSSSIDEEEL